MASLPRRVEDRLAAGIKNFVPYDGADKIVRFMIEQLRVISTQLAAGATK